jgi:polysaccharide deacetylase 2 family uncharacterized protein YibQ
MIVGVLATGFLEELPVILGAMETGVVSRDHPADSSELSPKIAIVLDDCGGNMDLARRVLSLDMPMTWAIIPNLKYSTQTAELLREAGIPFLVHVPMQAEIDAPDRAGRGYIIGAGMDEYEVRNALESALDSTPGAFGINNHRGSKATGDRDVMNSVMKILSERNLFFFDSRTSAKSVAYDAAKKHGLGAAFNSRFLDNESDRGKIEEQMNLALRNAKNKGMMAVICHLRPETVAFLESFTKKMNEGFFKTDVEFITLSEWTGYVKGD